MVFINKQPKLSCNMSFVLNFSKIRQQKWKEFTPSMQYMFVHENEAKLNEVKADYSVKI